MAVSAAASLLQWNYFPVGIFHDDAIYWLVSRALLGGSYVLPSDPSGVPLVNYLPGYPLFLSLFSWTGDPLFGRLASWFCTAGSVGLAWVLIKRHFGAAAGLWVLAWAVLQPIPLRYGTTLMSEPFYIFLSLMVFWIYEQVRESPAMRKDWLLAFLAGFSCWVRPMGVLLAAALIADALLRRRFRRGALVFAAVLIFQGGLSLWTFSRSQEASSFLGQWRFALQHAPASALAGTAWDNLAYYGDVLAYLVLFPFGKWSSVLQRIPMMETVLKAGILGAALWGWVVTWKSPRRAWSLYFLFYLMLIVFWLRPDHRYIAPLAPFAVLFFCSAFFLESRPVSFGRWGKGFVLAAVVLCSAVNFRGMAASFNGDGPRLPEEVYRWVRAHTAPEAVIAGNMASTLFLYTHRRGIDFSRTYDPEEFLRDLVEKGVSYVLVSDVVPAPPSRLPDVNDWSPFASLMVTHPGWFRTVKRFPDDQMTLHSVTVDPRRFREAHTFYQEGARAEAKGEIGQAETLLKAALALEPGLVGAYDRLAHLAASAGDFDEAEKRLTRALAAWPSFPLAYEHRALVRARLGDSRASGDSAEAERLARRYQFKRQNARK
ncbi:MAG: hypothetical protein HY548_04755 [Elusimicrobia bacterium]|nr:hypothetical protein [Elusimicrobiota bacterium]